MTASNFVNISSPDTEKWNITEPGVMIKQIVACLMSPEVLVLLQCTAVMGR